jgi:hypothetical protein
MEDEARKMEAKLQMLRNVMDSGDTSSKGGELGASGRWKSGSQGKPLTRNYVKGVMEAPSRKRGPARTAAATTGDAPESPPAPPFAPAAFSDHSPACYEVLGQAPVAMTGGAAGNLQAALSKQSGEGQEVEGFLADLSLDRYVSIFLENGFDCMEVVAEMEERHMREIGMASGHILKLTKKLAELRPPVSPPAAPSTGFTRKVAFGGVEAKPFSPAAAPQSNGCTSVAGGDFFDGAFNEEESAASFQEALRAWRQGGDVSSNVAAPPVSPPKEPVGPRSPKLGVGSFFSSIGERDMNLDRVRTPPSAAHPPPAVGRGESAQGDEKICCYQCYKQFFSSYAVERQSPIPGAIEVKRLCSEACADNWMQAMQAKLEAQQQRQERLDALLAAQSAIEQQQQQQQAIDDSAATAEMLENKET